MCCITGTNWKLSTRYWTSAILTNNSVFEWNPISQDLVPPSMPKLDNTDGTKKCVQLAISPSNNSVALWSRNCSALGVLACQVE
jgi:hypothetical protein